MEEQEGREEAHTGEVQGCQFHACNEKGGPERRNIQEERQTYDRWQWHTCRLWSKRQAPLDLTQV